MKTATKPCGNLRCSTSTAISGHLTFGHGILDELGFWQIPCTPCARAFERDYPEYGTCWPFASPDDSNKPGYDELASAQEKSAREPHRNPPMPEPTKPHETAVETERLSLETKNQKS